MITGIKKSATPFGALVVAVLFFIFVSIMVISGVTSADDGQKLQGDTLLTIHDRGVEKVIVTNAETIGDALKEADITIDASDAVEPAASQKLIASDYQVNIYRARPIIVVDGNVRQKIMTPYQTADQIAKSAGIILYAEDKAVVSAAENLADGASMQLTITRAIPFTFNFYGNTSTVRTQAKTVGEMLQEKNITLSAADKVSVDKSTAITEGLSVRVWREGKQTVTVSEVVPFEVEKIEDIDQPVSYRVVKSAGIEGSRDVTYEIIVQDGVEVGRTEIASIVTKQFVKQVEVVGAKGQYTTPTENENITWNFLISNGFNRYQTAGIMGNLMQEHHFNTTDTPGGLGIAQWTGSRRTNLINQYPNSYTNIYSQLAFLMTELNNGGVGNKIKNVGSLYEAVVIFQNQFERCGVCMQDSRVTYAQNILASH